MGIYEELVARGLIAQVTNEDEIREMINNGKATFYIGFDCTADSLTAGHFMALTLMKRLQMAGNKPIALIGGGTTMIGDPSGRTDMRKMLTKEDIDHNAECFKRQMERFIEFGEGKAVMLNNPSNPTGMFYTRPELEALAEVCVRHDLYILADEIYYKLLYDGLEFTSFAALGDEAKERTIIINGVSKSYAMTGWRIGYAASNKQLAKVMSNYLSHSTGAPSTISQWAAVEALNGPQEGIEAMRKIFEERRNYLVSRLNSIDGVSCITPNGAFYVMMNIEKLIGRTLGGRLIENDDDFGVAFLEKGLVAVVPCSGFGIKNFVRWTYATSMENIKEGLDRLEKFLAE